MTPCARTCRGDRYPGVGVLPERIPLFTNNSRPIVNPDDMEGLKIRTMESPVYMEMVGALGEPQCRSAVRKS